MLSPQFLEIFKKIENISVVGGYDLPLTRDLPNQFKHKVYKFFCFWIVFWYGALTAYGIYDNRSIPLAFLLEVGALGAVLTAVSASYDFLWYRAEYKEILLWVAELHIVHRGQFAYLYEKAFARSKSIIKATISILAATQAMMLGFACLVQLILVPVWTEDGKFNINLPYPMHFPWIPPNGWIGFSINFVHQHLGQALVFVAYVLFMVAVTVLLEFFGVQLEIIGEFASRVSDDIRVGDQPEKARKGVIEIIKMHTELTEYMDKLIRLTSRTFFTFKVNSFVFAFYIYVALFADSTNQVQALGGFGGLSLSFWLTYSCNIYQLVNERLLTKVNDIPWHEMPPKDRPILIPFIMKLQKPSLLKSKGVAAAEIITFEQFAATMQTVYSWCLLIQKVLVK